MPTRSNQGNLGTPKVSAVARRSLILTPKGRGGHSLNSPKPAIEVSQILVTTSVSDLGNAPVGLNKHSARESYACLVNMSDRSSPCHSAKKSGEGRRGKICRFRDIPETQVTRMGVLLNVADRPVQPQEGVLTKRRSISRGCQKRSRAHPREGIQDRRQVEPSVEAAQTRKLPKQRSDEARCVPVERTSPIGTHNQLAYGVELRGWGVIEVPRKMNDDSPVKHAF